MKAEETVRELAAELTPRLRTLREDLMDKAVGRGAYGPAPGPDGKVHWRRTSVTLLTVLALVLLVVNANQYSFGDHLSLPVGILLAAMQASALVLAYWEPLVAWWVTTVVTALAAWLTTAVAAGVLMLHGPGASAAAQGGWSPAAIIIQTGVLLLVSLRLPLRVAVEALGGSLLTGLLCRAFIPAQADSYLALAAVSYAVAVLVGASLRGRREARTQLVVQQVITAEERARRTLLEERNRIARELHDVVAHHMSVISIQAQVAPHLTENPSAELRESLTAIRQNALEALTELRRVLGVLRSEDPLAGDARDAPQPTLDRLQELLDNVRGTGLDVTVRTLGELRPLPPGVELCAYRIVQEALSNAMRHAPGAGVRVELDYRAGNLTVRVDNGAPAPAGPARTAAVPDPPLPGTGHGLLGMRERSAMLGGDLSSGPTPDGGYAIVAVLPLEAQP